MEGDRGRLDEKEKHMPSYVSQDFTAYRGDDFNLYSFTVKKAGFDWSASSGSTAKMQWRSGPGQTVIIELNWSQVEGTVEVQGSPIVYTSPLAYANANEDLQIPFIIPNSIMDDIPAGRYQYDLEITDPDGTVRTFFKGTITVEDDITRS
jgi:hypothetical protein